MTSVISNLNSSSVPLAGLAVWNGPMESCKNYTLISITAYSLNTYGEVKCFHYDKLGTLLSTNTFTYGPNPPNATVIKQFMIIGTHFAVQNTSTSVANQTVGKIITRLSNTIPDDMNVKLSSDNDSVTAKVHGSAGAITSESGKLLVKQNVLTAATDGVTATLSTAEGAVASDAGKLLVKQNVLTATDVVTAKLSTAEGAVASASGKLLVQPPHLDTSTDSITAVLACGADLLSSSSGKLLVQQNALTAADVVTAKLSTTQGDVASDAGKLLVKQNVLTAATDAVTAIIAVSNGSLTQDNDRLLVTIPNLSAAADNVEARLADTEGNPISAVDSKLCVLGYGVFGGSKVPLKVDIDGALSVNASYVPPAIPTSYNFCSTSLTQASEQVVASAKKVIRMNCFNDGAQVTYIRLHNMATAPVNTDVPLCVFAVQPASNINIEIGVNFSTGVYATACSNVGKVSAFGTVGADEIAVNIVYE